MKARILDGEALRAITPAALSAFARAEGWTKMGAYADKADIYLRENSNEILIPRHGRLGDYASVVSSLLSEFSRVLDADELALYRDLVCADRDVVRVRADDGVDDGAIDLDAGVKLVTQAKEMLLSAACSVRNPQPTYRAGANREAATYLDRVKLGQTEQGSFVVTMLSPVPPQLQPQLDPAWIALEDEPMERAVTRRLMDALQHARQAAELAASGQSDAFEDAVSFGVSANLCEAVSTLIDVSDDIDVSTTWARTRPTPEPSRRVAFSKSDAEVLREAARVFRLREPKTDVTLYGVVTKLRRDALQHNGLVTIKALVDEKVQSVSAELDEGPYSEAVAAHEQRVPVFLRGDLIRTGSRWIISRPELTTVEAEDNEDE